MNSLHHSHQDSSHFLFRYPSDDMRRLISSAHAALDQPPPPSLRDILTAYKSKGDGDRDMLLAMLNAKTAEDQRQASIANLQRTMLEIYKHPISSSEPVYPSSRPASNSNSHYPTPGFAQSPRSSEQSSRRMHHRHRVTSRSRSPPPSSRVHSHMPPSRDVQLSHHSEHPRKRHRSSHSPLISHSGIYESHPSEQFPPSPYSSSDRSESAEYSPRSRGSMTIGSLLSSGPSREVKGDVPERERD